MVGKVAKDFHCTPSAAYRELGFKPDRMALGEVYEYLALAEIHHRHTEKGSDKAAIYRAYPELYERYLLSLFDDDADGTVRIA